MALYYYLKSQEGRPVNPVSLTIRLRLRLLSLFLFSFGVGLLSWMAWPFLEWRVIYVPRFTQVEILKPIPSGGQSEVAGEETESLLVARNWFPQAPPQVVPQDSVKNYTLSIPKLKIVEAKVMVGGEDLSKSLIHYGGTALPGRAGTAVIFGHSVLPQFFDPQNYTAIFSTLHTLEKNEEILVNIEGIEYKYKIFGSEIVDPSDISFFLEQRYDKSYLYLVTCTPPGTYWKRLIVKAKLENL